MSACASCSVIRYQERVSQHSTPGMNAIMTNTMPLVLEFTLCRFRSRANGLRFISHERPGGICVKSAQSVQYGKYDM